MVSEIVFVPGMCSVGDVVYKDLVERLKKDIPLINPHIINLPSVDAIETNANLEPNGFQADVNAIRAHIQSLVNAGKSVIVIAHSYGGTPALYACDGLWHTQLVDQSGGVTTVGLLSSSLSLPGGTIGGDRQEWKKGNGQVEDAVPQMEQHGKVSSAIDLFDSFWVLGRDWIVLLERRGLTDCYNRSSLSYQPGLKKHG